jgi:hypothetical protein
MKTIELKANIKPLMRALNQVSLLMESPKMPPKLIANAFNLLSCGLDANNRLCSVYTLPTRRATEFWLVFEPSKRLIKLIATMRAFNGSKRKLKGNSHCLAPK